MSLELGSGNRAVQQEVRLGRKHKINEDGFEEKTFLPDRGRRHRAKRDGRFVEKIGHYDPHKDPPETVLDEEWALYWLGVGAQPSDTVRNIFSRAGVMEKFAKTGAKAGE